MGFNAGDIESKLTLDRTPFNQGLDKAERDARAFEKKRFKARVDVDVDQDRMDRAFERISKTKPPKIRTEVDVDGNQVEKKLDEVAKNTERTANRSGNRIARALLNPVVIQLGLLPAIAAVSAAGVGAALALPVVGIAAWGAAALKGNQEVKSAFSDLKQTVVADSKDMAQALQPALVGVANQAKTAWKGLKPEFQSMFTDAAPLVTELTNGLLQMGINAIPGIELALDRGRPAVQGFARMLGSIGTGLSDLFDNATRNAEAAGHGAEEFGVTLQTLLGFIGSLIGLFAQAYDMIGGQFNGALKQAVGFVTDFLRSALPAMAGGFHGVMLIIQGVMAVLGPFADVFGTATGAILGAVAAYKLLKLASDGIGKGFQAAKTGVEAVGAKMASGAQAIGLYSGAAQKASADQEKAEKSTSKWGTAVSKVSGIFQKLGNAIPYVGAAFVAVDAVMTELTKSQEDKLDELDQSMDKARANMERRFDDVRDTTKKAADAALFWNKAAQTFGSTSEQAANAQDILAKSTLAEKDAQERAAQATKTHTERILDYFDALAGGLNKQVAYNNSIKDVKEKQDELAKAIKDHGKNSMEAKFAQDELSASMANQVKAAGDLALAQNDGKSSLEKLTAQSQAQALESIKLIDIFGDKAPAALYKSVAALSDTELKAIGGKREFDNMGNAIINVPGYKPIKIDSNMAAEAQHAADLKKRVDELPTGNKFLTYFIQTVTTPGQPSAPFPIPGQHNAGGTEHFPGGWTWKDENGPEFVQYPGGTKIFTNQRSRGMVHEEVRKALAEGAMGQPVAPSVTNIINPPPLPDYEWLDYVIDQVSRSIGQSARGYG